MKQLSNRGRDYLLFLLKQPKLSERQLTHLAAEAFEDHTTFEKFSAGRQPRTRQTLVELIELGLVRRAPSFSADIFELTRAGEMLATEVRKHAHFRGRAERERRRAVAAGGSV